MLTSAAIGTDAVAQGSKSILVVETVAIVTVSLLVSQFATQVFTDMMKEEGYAVAQAGEAAEAPRVDEDVWRSE